MHVHRLRILIQAPQAVIRRHLATPSSWKSMPPCTPRLRQKLTPNLNITCPRSPPLPIQVAFTPHANQPYNFSHLPELPSPPSEKALSGLATHDELKAELNRMLSSMTSQLEAYRDLYTSAQILQIKRQMPRRQDKKNSADPAAANSCISA
jgi:hypothetical protein